MSGSKSTRIVGVILLTMLTTVFDATAQAAAEPEPAESPAAGAAAPADTREHAVAPRLELSLIDGEISWLDSDHGKFPVVYRVADRSPATGAIIINAAPGTVVDSMRMHRVLARTVTAAGWAVVSVQQPLPESPDAQFGGEALLARAVARLNAAIAYVARERIENVVIVGDAGGTAIAVSCIVQNASPAISGLVGIGAWEAPLDGLDIPILGVTGTRDTRAVRHQALRMAKLGETRAEVELLQVDGAGPQFLGYEEMVSKRIRGWLERAAPGKVVRAKPASTTGDEPG